MGEVFYLLQQWGRWVHLNSGIPSYHGAGGLFVGLTGSVLPEPTITDDKALEVDRAVTMLLARNRAAGEAVCVFFVCNCQSQADLGQRIGVSRGTARNLYDVGMSWLDCYFADLDEQRMGSRYVA